MNLPETWKPEQRRVLIILAFLLAGYVAIRYALNPTYVPNPQPPVPARASELADRLDPNTASVEDLAALPMIGERRAQDIVNYREKYVAERSGSLAFEEPNDLLAIRGIGASILDQIRPFLMFPGDATTTNPSND